MRSAVIRTLTALAEKDERVVLLTGDLGFMVIEPFADAYPDRFFNVGVAEQDMVGIATGLAEAGFLPFVYSIVTFATLRPFEFIRNGPVLHQLPVRVIGVGGGFEYGTAGPTHHGLEDVGVMRTLPGMTIVAPVDHEQAAAAVAATWDHPGPIYYRIGKDDRTVIPGVDGRFETGRVYRLREGSDVTLLPLGSVAGQALAAADKLRDQGIDAGVVIVPTIHPIDTERLADALRAAPVACTIEAHSVRGGLGSLVAETIADGGLACRLARCGVSATPDGVSGSEAFHLRRNGIDADAIVAQVKELTNLRHG